MERQQNYAVEVEDLTVAYDAKPVLWDIDLKIPRGKLMAVVGPNGAGKTTLIKAMLGLLKPVTGAVRFLDGNDDIRTLKNRIGYVPQSGSVDWDFPATVQDVVLMGCYGKLGWIRRPGKPDVELAKQMLPARSASSPAASSSGFSWPAPWHRKQRSILWMNPSRE